MGGGSSNAATAFFGSEISGWLSGSVLRSCFCFTHHSGVSKILAFKGGVVMNNAKPQIFVKLGPLERI